MHVIELHGLSKPGTSLQNIQMEIDCGAAVGLSAIAGSESSPLVRILALDDDNWSGEFFLLGTPIHELGAAERREVRRAHLGVVRSDDRLVPELTVFENLELPLTLRTRRVERDALIRPILEMLDLTELRDYFPRALSRRETQLSRIARAVIGEPAAIIADDLSGCLRPSDWARVCVLLRREIARGAALVLVNRVELHALFMPPDTRSKAIPLRIPGNEPATFLAAS